MINNLDELQKDLVDTIITYYSNAPGVDIISDEAWEEDRRIIEEAVADVFATLHLNTTKDNLADAVIIYLDNNLFKFVGYDYFNDNIINEWRKIFRNSVNSFFFDDDDDDDDAEQPF